MAARAAEPRTAAAIREALRDTKTPWIRRHSGAPETGYPAGLTGPPHSDRPSCLDGRNPVWCYKTRTYTQPHQARRTLPRAHQPQCDALYTHPGAPRDYRRITHGARPRMSRASASATSWAPTAPTGNSQKSGVAPFRRQPHHTPPRRSHRTRPPQKPRQTQSHPLHPFATATKSSWPTTAPTPSPSPTTTAPANSPSTAQPSRRTDRATPCRAGANRELTWASPRMTDECLPAMEGHKGIDPGAEDAALAHAPGPHWPYRSGCFTGLSHRRPSRWQRAAIECCRPGDRSGRRRPCGPPAGSRSRGSGRHRRSCVAGRGAGRRRRRPARGAGRPRDPRRR